ncbi:MAG: hypothetical protein SF053_21830 [Bacteroidia bacterium]|nr:hypothetical protein [Bacteroidia bacterium]
MDPKYSATYPHFAPNQVLTDTQLNGLHHFLDEQNRITRTHGIGAGIVCGLKAAYVYGETCDEHYIVVSPGYGFSSEGYLIQVNPPAAPTGESGLSPCIELPFKGLIFNHVRKYIWPERDVFGDNESPYADWQQCSPPTADQSEVAAKSRTRSVGAATRSFATQTSMPVGPHTIWELLTAEDGITYQKEAVELDELHVTNHVLVLFLEKGYRKEKPCVETDCTQNDQMVYNVRALLVHKDCYASHAACAPLALLHIPRFHTHALPPETKRTKTSLAVRGVAPATGSLANVTDYLDINRAYGRIVEKMKAEVLDRITQSFDRYKSFLALEPEVDMEMLKYLLHLYFDEKQYDRDYHQYHYDFVRDLIAGYNTFIAAACKLTGSCWPVAGFPRHLGVTMFGQVKDQVILTHDAGYRTPFYPSPVHNVSHGDRERVRKLFLRLRDMICYYAFDHDIVAFAGESHRTDYDVRITPSQTEVFTLGRRAIPYYYDLMKPAALSTFQENWQPADCCTDEALLGYYFHQEEMTDGYAVEDLQTNPLYFSLLGYTFLRIEGHVGKTCEEAEVAIEALRQAHNLEFDLVFVHLHEKTAEIKGKTGATRQVYQVDSQAFFSNLGPATGLEHTGGVPVGGSFIVICDKVCVGTAPNGEKINEIIAVADFSLHKSIACCLKEEKEPAPVLCPVLTDIQYVVEEYIREKDSVILVFTATVQNPAGTTYTWELSSDSKLYSTTQPILKIEYPLKSGSNFNITVTTQGPGTCPPTTLTSEVEIDLPGNNPGIQPSAGVVQKQQSIQADLRTQLATRATRYNQEVFALNAKGDFARSAIFDGVLNFVASEAGIEVTLDQYRDLSGKILSTYARAKEGDKRRAYAQMSEIITHKTFDRALALDATDETTLDTLSEQVTKLKVAGLTLSRIRTNWRSNELSGADTDTLDILAQLIN